MRTGGKRSAWRRQSSMDAPMNRSNAFERGFTLAVVAEADREHRPDGVMEPRERRRRAATECAVFRDAGGDERMRELQQDGAHPAEHDQALRVDGPRDGRRR